VNPEPTTAAPTDQRHAALAVPTGGILEPVFGGLAQLAARVCQTPLASIVLAGCGEAWCTTNEPLAAAAVPLHDPFSKYTLLAPRLFEVTDATLDERFRNLECVIGTLVVRSYAGCALRTARGDVLGTLSIYGTTARLLSPDQRASLMLLAEQGVAQVEIRAHLAELTILSAAQPATPPPASAQVVAADGGTGFVATITDRTDLVTSRDNLRDVETMFRNTFDQAPIGIAHADRRGRILRCNQAFCTLLRFDPGDLVNKTMGDVTHSDDVARVAAELKRLWNGQVESVDLEKRYLRKDGSFLWVRMTTALVREGDAKPEYSVEYLRDISARKESAEELERVHKLLMTASRQAGMAEVATNVLHNVGNILNSVNISTSLVVERVKQSKAPGVGRVATLLLEKGQQVGEFLVSDERGKRIPEYLATLGEQLMTDQQMALQELAALRENLEHIKETVAMQQSYAKLCGVTETVAVVDLVEDSLRLNAGAFVRHGVTLRREFNEVPPIIVDKHKVLQILVNLVRNAKYACDESGKTEKLITLRIDTAANGVRISVIDNGVGILAENMDRLFTHGFTTRQSGHGFGLHSGALAAQQLGGSLHAESDGLGCGATFILELPCSPAEPVRA
jgi:PAS domain S-box-containing protein